MEINEQHNAALAKVAEMVGDARFAMLTTLEKDGVLRSRPMATMQLDGEGNLWFFTSLSSSKIAKAQPDQQVNLCYVRADKHDYLSVSGAAELVDDKEKMQALWSPWIRPWFPKGLDDPDLALLKVSIMEAEYWDAPDSATARAYGLVKALATGDTDALGEHRKIDVKEE
ncbi:MULTISPECIES: pyridoxamine 5'-phosphate oxidase family protein [unclassified Nitrosospira]|jgi:general stress protein 26|uniref:pyridoxamine 5'-phosphate oxidase family protein n=1 Tax=unclassified Nitrosospira TaxID=2609267 RepID=UPI000D324CFE|nr:MULTISPECIES: pyridoxamine 5'-phosphate oxidase family protein [unclassified Nitrosospira]PTR17585.1 general stress protein 26 [Nitrosospira sp. Nsp2]WON74105.1 pyridoxamine 5'-phosphate oxidase family protein [Nitrosospira sp. Is2]